MLESFKAHMETLVLNGKVRKSMMECKLSTMQYMLNVITSYDIIVIVDIQGDGEGYSDCGKTREWYNRRSLQNKTHTN